MERGNISRRSFISLAGGAVASAALAGCGGSQATTAEVSSVAGGTEGGGTLTASLAATPDGYSPQTTTNSAAVSVNWLVLEGLYRVDPHTYEVSPELATGDPTQIDETTYEVTLRSGAQFSDGTSVTPDDVAHSFVLAAAEESPFAYALSPIASVAKKDEATLTITTVVPNFPLLRERLALVRVTPAVQPVAAMNKRPLGSGPWAIDSADDTAVELVPNSNYNGAHPANDEKIHFDLGKDAAARATSQREGSTLAMEGVSPDAVSELEQAGCVVDTCQGLGARFLMFNVKKAPWDSVLVRQAALYALDYDQMVESVFSGLAKIPTSFVPEGFPYYHAAATAYTHDPDYARELLTQAAIEPGDVKLRYVQSDELDALAHQIQSDLSVLGFNVSLKGDSASATYAAIDGGEAYDLLLDAGDPSCFGCDPDLLMGWWYGSSQWMGARCPWSDTSEYQALSALMSQALTQPGEEQQQSWNQCFDLLAQNAVLYPVLQVPSLTASWRDAPNGSEVKIKNFEGIGAPGLSLLDATTVSA